MDKPYFLRLIEAVADLTAWLKDQAVPGAVIGGLAASLWGRPRVAKGVDAVVLLKGANLETFLTAGARFGFARRIGNAAAFAVKSRVLLLLHEPSKTQVDVH